MLQLFMPFLIFLTSIIFMQMNHPLAMGLILLVQTIFICFLTGMISLTFWFSYILFLTFLGGMLVLFIYVTSLASNEMFNLSTKIFINTMIYLSILLLMILILDKTLVYNYIFNNEMMTMTNILMFSKENIINLNKLYNFPTNLINLMMMNYLFLTLIAIVKITNIFKGPLRNKY